MANKTEPRRLNHSDWVYSVAFSPDGLKLVTASNDKAARIWDVKDCAELHKFNHDQAVYSVAFSPAGDRIATGSADTTARIWDAETGEELTEIETGDVVLACSFDYGGDRLVTASGNTAKVYALSGDGLLNQACSRLTHNLSSEICADYAENT